MTTADEDEDLFGSDDESEDEEAKKVKEANLAAYRKKKEGKTKPAAKSIVTLDVKPWGTFPYFGSRLFERLLIYAKTMKQI